MEAKRTLAEVLAVDLDPLGQGEKSEWALRLEEILSAYPSAFDLTTLKGFFGEIFAGLAIEHFDIAGRSNWRVPALFFRFHDAAFTMLETWISTTGPLHPLGRTGHDVLAFSLQPDGVISHWLKCEAKCTNDHDSHLVSDAHEQVSDPVLAPVVHLSRLIQILRQRDDSESEELRRALELLLLDRHIAMPTRDDAVSYVCGRGPVQANTWISPTEAHEKYTAGRTLEAVEAHLTGVDALVQQVYS